MANTAQPGLLHGQPTGRTDRKVRRTLLQPWYFWLVGLIHSGTNLLHKSDFKVMLKKKNDDR